MADKKKFKTALFGFKKKAVVKYIGELSCELENKDAKIANLEAEIAKYKEEIDKTESRSSAISSAIMKAEEYANEIIEKAKNSAAEIKDEISKQFADEESKLARYKQEVAEYREFVVRKLKNFSDEL